MVIGEKYMKMRKIALSEIDLDVREINKVWLMPEFCGKLGVWRDTSF